MLDEGRKLRRSLEVMSEHHETPLTPLTRNSDADPRLNTGVNPNAHQYGRRKTDRKE